MFDAACVVDALLRVPPGLVRLRHNTPRRLPPRWIAWTLPSRVECFISFGAAARIRPSDTPRALGDSEGHWRAGPKSLGRTRSAPRCSGCNHRDDRATWLDQQLIGGGSGLGDLGFGGEAKQAMQQRTDFLAEQGLAERRG